MAYTDPNSHIFVTGEIVSAANLKTYVGDNIVALRNGYACRAYKTSTPNVAAGLTTLFFEADVYDNAAIHDTGANTDRLTLPVAGVWHAGAMSGFGDDGAGEVRTLQCFLNGTLPVAQVNVVPVNGVTIMNVAADWKVAVGDYFSFKTYHDNVINLDIGTGGGAAVAGWCHFTGANG